jgi:hypothetical protein
MTKAELRAQIDAMTEEEAAEVKLIFDRGDPEADGNHPDEPGGLRPAFRLAAHRRRGISAR